MPLQKMPFRSVVVASTNDPFATMERAKFFAASWGSRLMKIENAGHINTASGHGPWPEGEGWLEELRAIRA
jgi:predicted alpha/beta hydrolase family esterase